MNKKEGQVTRHRLVEKISEDRDGPQATAKRPVQMIERMG